MLSGRGGLPLYSDHAEEGNIAAAELKSKSSTSHCHQDIIIIKVNERAKGF